MSDFLKPKSNFLQKLVAAIEVHLENEAFGVTELAEQVHMSRSSLLRKVKQETGESVSVYIRNVRLHHGHILLLTGDFTVSEIAYRVGFSSTSYFTKCYREYFGYTPGEAIKRTVATPDTSGINLELANDFPKSRKKSLLYAVFVVLLIVISVFLYLFTSKQESTKATLNKSIAVLPFKNDSPDSSNVYFMNGLMEAILHNFQKVEDFNVLSRTSSENYRSMNKSIAELADELGVDYFVEGSGQKVEDDILLNIQLIEAPSGRQIWSRTYQRKLKDVFQIQAEVAQSIAQEINVLITPEEKERIEQVPTQNLVAYDYYLNGLALLQDRTGAGLQKGLEEFKKSILEDGDFTEAYANVAISYYYLDLFRAEKKHTESIKKYAEHAMELDSSSGESLIAQALYYMQVQDFQQAVIAFERVLAYYPNLSWIHNALSNIYTVNLPNTEKYLEHALQGMQAALEVQDSVTVSFTYLHLSNALAQTGFLEEAAIYVQRSLDYNPQNLFSQCLAIYIQLGENFDLLMARQELLKVLAADTNRIDVIQEIAKVYYTMEDYPEAWKYYKSLTEKIAAMDLNIYQSEYIKIGYVLEQLGRDAEAQIYYDSYLQFAENDQSLYHDLLMASYYAVTKQDAEAIKHFKAFTEEDNYQYWIVLFLEKDPITRLIEDHPDFKPTIERIKTKFWNQHEQTRTLLVKEGIIESGNKLERY